MRRRPDLMAGLVRGARDVARLVLPVECPGCGAWDLLLCDGCAGALDGPAVRCEAHVPRLDRMDGSEPLPVWRVAPYAGPVRGVVVAWKDKGRLDLTRLLTEALTRAAVDVAPLLAQAAGAEPILVVPVPTSPGARRRRGADLVSQLAEAVAQGLCRAGVPARVEPLLVRGRRRDQVGLGARARRANVAGSVRLRSGRPGAAGGRPRGLQLLVDDVVTTGSTLAACEDVLTGGGRAVVGALVLAATPAPQQARLRLLAGREED